MKNKHPKSGIVLALSASLLILGCARPPDMPQELPLPPAARDVPGMLVFGDSGYLSDKPGKSALMPVAKALARFCADYSCSFGVMTGDNIYPRGADGLASGSRDAERFRDVFIEPYGKLNSEDANFRLHMAFGNHDWLTSRAGAKAQLQFAENTRPFYMDGFFYSTKPVAAQDEVELFVIDTEMMLAARQGASYDILDTGEPAQLDTNLKPLGTQNAVPQTDEERAQLEWLAQGMRNSQAKWKIVVGHHPLWESNGGKHEQTIKLREFLRPVVCQYADVYLAGHQHTLEIHRDSCTGVFRSNGEPLLHIVSGAAGKSRSVNENYAAWQKQNHPEMSSDFALGDSWGFVYLSIEDHQLSPMVMAAPRGARSVEEFKRRY